MRGLRKEKSKDRAERLAILKVRLVLLRELRKAIENDIYELFYRKSS